MTAPGCYLQPGELVVGSEPFVATTVLGSCVAVYVRHKDVPIAGLNHFLLSRAGGRTAPTGRYGDLSIRALLRLLAERGARAPDLVAQVLGGADGLGLAPGRSTRAVGPQNVEVALSVLRAGRIPVAAIDVGGTWGRRVVVDTGRNRVTVTAVTGRRDLDSGR